MLIRTVCENEKLWVSINETTDSSGRKVGNDVVDVLKNDKSIKEKSFLVKGKELSAANHISTRDPMFW